MVSKRMLGLGTARSVIRELFEYGNQRAAVVGRENVYDFSLGNPSVPAPDAVNEAAIRILREQPELIHCYTSAQGDAAARQRFADSLNRRFGGGYTADQLYITVGAAASLCCVFHGLTCPGDEFIVFAPYFPEYKVFIEGAGAKMVLIPPEIEHFQIDFAAFEQALTPHTKGVVVNSPNNPSGVVYSRETLERLGRRRSTATPSTSSPTSPTGRSCSPASRPPGSPTCTGIPSCATPSASPSPSPASGWAMCWSPDRRQIPARCTLRWPERGGPWAM